jgi:hypothetical protein
MPLAGFEPGTPASERPQTYALPGAATGIGCDVEYKTKYRKLSYLNSTYRPTYDICAKLILASGKTTHEYFRRNLPFVYNGL